MIQSLDKKIIERHNLTRFLEEIKLTDDIIDIKDFEQPDFIVKFTDRFVGVELTSLYHDVKSKEERVAIDKIISRAQKKFEKDSTLNFVAYITLKDPILIKGKDFANLSFELAEYMKQLIGNKSTQDEFEISIDRWYQSDRVDLLPWLEGVRIVRRKKMNYSIWQHSKGYMSGNLKQDFFQEKLASKEIKIDKYKENAQTQNIWLIFIIEGKEYSDFSYTYEVTQRAWQTKFEKIFLYEFWGDVKVAELKCYT